MVKSVRFHRVVSGLSFLAALVLPMANRAAVPAAGVDRLKSLLNDSGLKYTWDDSGGFAKIPFSDIESMDTKAVFAYVSDKEGEWAKVRITVLDAEKAAHFPATVVRRAMALNRQYWLVQFAYDEKWGDIDAAIGMRMEVLTGKLLKDYIKHLVSTGEQAAKDLKGVRDSN